MKAILLILFLMAPVLSFAQEDTLWFDKEWKPCKNKTKASFYRLPEKQQGGYLIRDYYLETNTVQMLGFSTTKEPLHLEGKCTYYSPDGKKEMEGYYKHDVKTGIWTTWIAGGDSTVVNEDKIVVVKKPRIIKKGPLLYDPDHPFSVSARGKAIGFFIIEDTYFLTFSLGPELMYRKHSLGIDGSWFRWRYERDNSDDVGMYSQYELRNWLHLDYKYTFVAFDPAMIDLYFNVYDKIGNYQMWYDRYEDYDFGTRDMAFLESTAKGTFNEPGLGFGIRKYADGSRFGIDCSANVGYRFTNNNERTVLSATETAFRDHVKGESFEFYMRLNLFYNFGK
ncbi:MAG: hypothetical protein JWO44_2322 [Bacteroidetes bacterium]|nr:hypothetical protein [Bacteroidota bacterium]